VVYKIYLSTSLEIFVGNSWLWSNIRLPMLRSWFWGICLLCMLEFVSRLHWNMCLSLLAPLLSFLLMDLKTLNLVIGLHKGVWRLLWLDGGRGFCWRRL
jgi:hypothetical protein